jgi:lipopolysaccharide/colanic/teichoic acid biosynthesis glycosyltransferase
MINRNPVVLSHSTLSKRIFDVVLATLGCLVALPVFLLVALAIKLDDGGPIFYRATRVGRRGQLFRLYKFRTMRVGADQQGPGVTTQGDTRVTRVGRWLRRTKIDELPQLLNVLANEMSLVGPRPEDPRYVALYTPEQRQILYALPGITSAASLAYRHEEQILAGADWETMYREKVMPAKLAIDLEYMTRRTLWTDIHVIVQTVKAVFG